VHHPLLGAWTLGAFYAIDTYAISEASKGERKRQMKTGAKQLAIRAAYRSAGVSPAKARRRRRAQSCPIVHGGYTPGQLETQNSKPETSTVYPLFCTVLNPNDMGEYPVDFTRRKSRMTAD
jgi:hypothetical protein